MSVSCHASGTVAPVVQPLTLDVARSAGTTTARPAATTATAPSRSAPWTVTAR